MTSGALYMDLDNSNMKTLFQAFGRTFATVKCVGIAARLCYPISIQACIESLKTLGFEFTTVMSNNVAARLCDPDFMHAFMELCGDGCFNVRLTHMTPLENMQFVRLPNAPPVPPNQLHQVPV